MTSDPLPEMRRRFREAKAAADGALAQVPDAMWFRRIDPEANTICTLVQHLSGNMISRWTDFLTTDGEKADRHRDLEFVDPAPDAIERPGAPAAHVQVLRARWEKGWSLAFEELDALGPGDLERVVTIRGEPHSVLQATMRQLGHAWYHVGQIVLLSKHLAGPEWRTLSVPKGGSEAHNAAMRTRFGNPPVDPVV